MSLLEKTRDFLSSRALAYRQVFSTDNVYTERVLADLAKFCRANEPTFHADSRMHAVAEGRREVWLRICHHLKLNDEQIWNLYERKDFLNE